MFADGAPSAAAAKPSGNRCGHDPKRPQLTPANPIRKGKGGLPRILSLAAERAREWYTRPGKCSLLFIHSGRKVRSERREACLLVLETLLSHLDLASLCLGTPTLDSGFIDIDMRTIVRDSGLGQRRIERAIALFKNAGFMLVSQPRAQNADGDYFGCRAIRVMTTAFFEWLGLGPMLRRERKRASEALRKKALRANRKLSDFMRRVISGGVATARGKSSGNTGRSGGGSNSRIGGLNKRRIAEWNAAWAGHVRAGADCRDAQRRTNVELGYPPDFSPGQLRS